MTISGVSSSSTIDPAELFQQSARTNRSNPAQTRTLQSGDGDSDVDTAYQKSNPSVDRIADQTSASSSAARSGQYPPPPPISADQKPAPAQQAVQLDSAQTRTGIVKSARSDPRDANENGEISNQEQLQYDMQTLLSSSPAVYTPQGKAASSSSGQEGVLVNIFG